ncbi:DUF1145 domain-containing protein [Shewanella gaetbuli]|uniref:DUF1145 domain-containing protein n=1 Tax=Shewanella gaetbuli TaxID=220752 RepID=A0A9X2CMA2_9GAMM|nr:DUF1145 domain-containing protein [Shewanella gaetbuli]MCL1143465.1 DUF1145 domain-containing protein [Shewanella gaetbuli]
MNYIIKIGYGLTSVTWLVLLFNLIMPFDNGIGMILYIFLAFMAVMHGLQVFIFHTLFSPQLTLTAKDYATAYLFGVFALLSYRQKILQK